MGWEYKIRFSPIEKDRIDKWLREHEHFFRFVDEFASYEFRRPDNTDPKNMPNLDVRIEEDGLYVNNLDSNYMMYDIAHILLVEYDRIEIASLD